MKEKINEIVKEFSLQSHGRSDMDKDQFFIRGAKDGEYVPFTYLLKKCEDITSISQLQNEGYVISSYDFLESQDFEEWYQKQFNHRLSQKDSKNILIVHMPDASKIFEAVEIVTEVYRILKDHKVLVNGKNLPVQLGEWYTKLIFGFKQIKSSSQRGFDFVHDDGKKVEVKVHWQDITSPKGVKLKKSLVELSQYTVIIYISKNFRIRDVLLLDSEYILRKFDTKGHTIFLKDTDISSYFFSKSDKHFDKIVNMKALLQFATPNLAIKLDEKLNQNLK